MKRILAVILAVLSVLMMFASCSKEKTEQTPEQPQSSRPVPEAKYNPQILDAGRRKNSLNTSDLWYPDNGDGSKYIYFTKTETDFRLTYVEGKTEKSVKCTVSKDNRLISDKTQDIKFDIAFYDAFNCYDYIGECWYSRENADEIKSALVGKTLAQQGDNSNTYVFNEDGTCVENYKGSSIEGTWSITASTAIVISFREYNYTYDIDFDDTGKIIGMSQRGGRVFDIVD